MTDVGIDRITADSNEKQISDLVALLIMLHSEGGYAPLNLDKMVGRAAEVVSQGMTWLAYDQEAGEPVGTLGLHEQALWYADERVLVDLWFYVRPEYRKGAVGKKLLKLGRETADERGCMLFITVTNPDRRRRRSAAVVEAETVGYVSHGYMLKMERYHGRLSEEGRGIVDDTRDSAVHAGSEPASGLNGLGPDDEGVSTVHG